MQGIPAAGAMVPPGIPVAGAMVPLGIPVAGVQPGGIPGPVQGKAEKPPTQPGGNAGMVQGTVAGGGTEGVPADGTVGREPTVKVEAPRDPDEEPRLELVVLPFKG